MQNTVPLAERMRPKQLSDYIGQEHLVAEDAVLGKAIAAGVLPSFILWGPPGVGKTTLAYIVARSLSRPFIALSAINSGVKDIREAIHKAESQKFFNSPNPILFIDEIHRFSKSQQDALLGAVERGTVTLIGATTENPSFEVIPALLSRCQVYTLNHLTRDDLVRLVDQTLIKDEILKLLKIKIESYDAMIHLSGGDARKLLNILEIYTSVKKDEAEIVISDEDVAKVIRQNMNLYDKGGEMHYDTISAFIKSVRGSDTNAALYYMARMLEGGEDPLFICRRMIILAAEDIGLANPNALLLANNCFQAVHHIGMPEARIPMSETAIYLSLSPKSNSAYTAIDQAIAAVREHPNAVIPLHLRNAPTSLMKELGYGKDYKYAHDYKYALADQQYLPDVLINKSFYNPGNNAAELKMNEQLENKKKGKNTDR